jgi:DNA (cytosine-5)-methyltransferase 1
MSCGTLQFSSGGSDLQDIVVNRIFLMYSLTMKAIDFFCGAGGMTYGFRQAGIDVIAGIDIEESLKDTYEQNNPGSSFICQDIETMETDYLEKALGISPKQDDMVFIGCSPCQYWTKINTQKEKSEKTKDLLFDLQRFIEYYQPGYIVIENVPGIKTKSKQSGLMRFRRFLEKTEKKYTYMEDVVVLSKYGVPQTRKRYLLIANRFGLDSIYPKEQSSMPTVRDFIGQWNGFKPITAGTYDRTTFQHTAASLSEKNYLRIALTPKDGGKREAWRQNNDLQITAYRNKDNIFTDVYGRMSWDKPAPTITTRFNSLSNGRFGHPEEDRAISLREGATLQTFPKDYVFYSNTMNGIAKQIGNAVPPYFAKQIAKLLLKEHNYLGQILKQTKLYSE